MCVSTITIANKKYNYRAGLDQAFLSVPCGNCYQCRKRKGNDWYVRSAYEFLDCVDNHGQNFFVTLTYNPANLPLFEYIEGYGLQNLTQDFLVFNKKHVTSFFKQLLLYLGDFSSVKYSEKLGFTPFTGSKYFCVPELGGENKHPHYHFIQFCPSDIDSDAFLKLCKLAWSDKKSFKNDVSLRDKKIIMQIYARIQAAWRKDGMYISSDDTLYFKFLKEHMDNPYFILLPPHGKRKSPVYMFCKGFVSYARDKTENGFVVRPHMNAPLCCKYIVKYFCKNDVFSQDENMFALRDWKINNSKYHADIMKGDISDDGFLSAWKYVVNCLPFVVASKGYGERLFQECKLKMDNQDFQSLVKPISIKSDNSVYRLPQYIINRLFYEYEKHLKLEKYDGDVKHNDDYVITVIRRLTENGYKCVKLRYELYIQDFISEYEKFMNISQLSTLPAGVVVGDMPFSLQEIFGMISRYSKLVTPQQLAVYSLVYRNVVVFNESHDEKSLFDNAKELWLQCLHAKTERLPLIVDHLTKFPFGLYKQPDNKPIYFNDCPPFCNSSFSYEEVLKLYDVIRTNVTKYLCAYKREELEKNIYIKQLYQKFMYYGVS